jgi:hypothetical protein
MNTSRIPLTCALGALTAWTLKAVAIGIAGGLGRSPLEDPLFLTGLALALASVVSLGLLLTVGRHPAVRAGGVVLGVIAVFAVTVAVDAAAHAFTTSDHWVLTEVNLWVLALLLLAATASSRRPEVEVTPRPATSRS